MKIIQGSFCMIVPPGAVVDLVMLTDMIGSSSPMTIHGINHPGTVTGASVIHEESVVKGILMEYDLEYLGPNPNQ